MVKPISTEGGLRGKLIRVTTLAADGPGSIGDAIKQREPRLVVFEVGGVIDLGGRTLVVISPHLTIAGQTAPDPGITLIRGGLIVETHDVVIQHIAVRPGDNGATRPWEPDALGARRGKEPVHHVVFDHCSATWGVDENLSVSGPADADGIDATAHDVTLSHCLIAEGLSHATHSKGEHSKGTLIHDGVRNVAIIGCLYAHNRERNPRLKGGTTTHIADSVMYNWGSACIGVGARGNKRMLQPAEAVIRGNVAIAGPDTRDRRFVKELDAGGRLSMSDNVLVDRSGAPLAVIDKVARVLRSAGSRPARRDPIDAGIVQSVIHGDGAIIDSQEQVGGYPVRARATRALIVPEDIEERRRWLESLSHAIEEDTSLDLAPLRARLSVRRRSAMTTFYGGPDR
ncbi:MAG TPA: right-handed parallel beta-helix repeat-containing protein [Thermoanaerobaculia bacterium]